MRKFAIAANADNFDTFGFEILISVIERDDLARADEGKIFWIKEYDRAFFADIFIEVEILNYFVVA